MNPMQSTRLMVGALIVDGRRIRRYAGSAAVCAILSLGLAGSFPVAAQEPDAAAQEAKPMRLRRLKCSLASAKWSNPTILPRLRIRLRRTI